MRIGMLLKMGCFRRVRFLQIRKGLSGQAGHGRVLTLLNGGQIVQGFPATGPEPTTISF